MRSTLPAVPPPLFPDLPPLGTIPRIGEQKDIRYYGITAKRVLNPPESTGMGFWSLNPYTGCAFGCAYCYARYAHRYAWERADTAGRLDAAAEAPSMPPWLAFERRIMVKHNAVDALRRALRQGSDRHLGLVRGEAIVIGSATDPYQPAERRYRITRQILEELVNYEGLRVNIITKSPLVTRDIDLLVRLSRRSEIGVHLSLITLRRDLARRLEPRAPTPEARVRALTRLREAGIDAGINCMPVLPGITDNPADLEALVKRVSEAGATYVAACALRLRSAARDRYLPFIASEFPHLAERYRNAYARSHQPSERYREGLRAFFRRLCLQYGVSNRFRDEDEGEEGSEGASSGELGAEGQKPGAVVQMELPIEVEVRSPGFADRGSGRGADLGSGRGADCGADLGSGRGADRGEDRGSVAELPASGPSVT